MATSFRLGSGYASLVADAIFRGSVGTPPSSIYVSLGGAGGFVTKNEKSSRTQLIRSRGLFNGMYGTDYYHESPRTAIVDSSTVVPISMHFPEATADTEITKLMGHDAATGGNLLFCAIHPTMYAYGGDAMGYYVPADDDGVELKSVLIPVYGMKPWISSIVHDWLFRGYNSFDSWFPVSTYPNVYISLEKPNGTRFSTTLNNIAISRSTGSWSSVSSYGTDQIPRQIITNASPISFGIANESNSGLSTYIRIRATSTTQSFDDTLAFVSVGFGAAWAINDSLVIPAGALEIEIH